MNARLEMLKATALSFLGKPYVWGGDDPINGFDCSGLVQEILASVGMDPKGDQTAQGIYDIFNPIGTPLERGLGALAFYGKSIKEITHIAMLLDEEHIIEAGGGGSKTLTAQDAIRQNAFVRIRRVDNRSDLVAIVMPPYEVRKNRKVV